MTDVLKSKSSLNIDLSSRTELEKLITKLCPLFVFQTKQTGLEIALSGPLGAGKTTLVRFLAQSLRSRELVSSPTYVLEQEYSCDGGLTLEHWDLYRIGALPQELEEPVSPGVLRAVEWAEKFPEIFGRSDASIHLEFGEDPMSEKRQLTFECSSWVAEEIVSSIPKP